MRWLTAICALATYTASAQITWEWSSGYPGKQPVVTDCEIVADRVILSVLKYEGPLGTVDAMESNVILLDAIGQPISSDEILPQASSVAATSIVPSPDDSGFFITGSCGFDDSKGLFAVPLSDDGIQGGPTTWTSTITSLASVENAVWPLGRGVILCGSLRQGGFGAPNRIALVEITPDGGVVRDTLYGISGNQSICRQIMEWNGTLRFSVDGVLDQFPGASSNSIFSLNDELGVQDWLLLPRLDTDPNPPFDSVLVGSLDIRPLTAQRFASAGRFGPIFNPMASRVAVVVSDTVGTLYHTFLPRSNYPQDITPFVQSLDNGSDDALWFAMHENAQVGPPSLFSVYEPNRIKVFKLDSNLNALCSSVLDGFWDNTYYYVNRIKSTPDGGFLLLGAKREFDDPSGLFKAWVRKFGPDDCTVGMEEHSAMETAVVYPNPGRGGFTLLLNGPAINGSVQLHDAQGRLLSTTSLWQGQAQVSALECAAGLYHYRVLDGAGRPVASGRWMKQ